MKAAQDARQSVLDQLELNYSNKTTVTSIDFANSTVTCMLNMLQKIETIKVGPIIAILVCDKFLRNHLLYVQN